ncbi:MAG: PspC domain-containing protein [bacterium]|nr:PspC domain-containing protein [bacterium]
MDKKIKKIYRSRKKRMLAGICGGLADYFEVDPTLARIVFLFFLFMAGSGLLIYLILIFIVPLEPEVKSASRRKKEK